MSETPGVHQAWAAVQAEIKAVGKDERNTQQSYNFRGIDGVMNAVGPALRKHGVTVTPHLVSREMSTVEVGKNRTPMAHVVVEVDYTVRGPAGDTFTGRTPGEAMDSGDKAMSKAMSVAYRTFLIQGLTLPTDEPDPDATTYERSAPGPLAALKHRVWSAATAVGITDRESLAAYYAEQMGGLVLADAGEDELTRFLEVLTKAKEAA